MLKHGILGLLNYGDMTGYEIREVFNKSLNFFGRLKAVRFTVSYAPSKKMDG